MSLLPRLALIAAVVCLVGRGTACAQTIRTFTDNGGNVNWSRTQNWTGGVLPSATEIAALGNQFNGGSVNLQSTPQTVLAVQVIQPSIGVTSWTLNGANTGIGLLLASGSLTRFSTVTGTQTFVQAISLGTNSAAATAAVWTIDGADRLVVSGTIFGSNAGSSLTKTGTGILELSGVNTFGGAFTINQGTVSVATINNGGVAGVTGTSSNLAANFVLGGGGLEYTGVTASTDRSFTLTNATTSTINVTTAATNLTFTGSSASTTGALTKTGAGTLTLSGLMNYTGATTVTGGTLTLGSSNRLSDSTAVTLNGGVLAMGLLTDTVGSLTMQNNALLAFSITGTTSFGSLSLGSGALTFGAGVTTLGLTTNLATGSAVRYDLITYGSRSGTFSSVTSVPSGYRIVYGGLGTGTVSLAQFANQTFVPTTGLRALVSSTSTVTGTLTNTSGSSANAPLDVSVTGSTASPQSFLGSSSSSGATVAGGNGTSLITGTLTTQATAGTQTWSMVNSDPLATTTSATASGTLTVVNNRTYSPTSISLNRFLSGTTASGTATITSSGLTGTTASGTLGSSLTNSVANGFTLSLASGTNGFNGSVASQTGTYTLGGTYSGALGAVSGSFTTTGTNEFGGTTPVAVSYTGTAVNQRSFTVTTSTVALGRYLITDTNFSATTSVQSTGTFGTTASGTLGTFSTQNGLTLALTSGSADFAGQTNSQTAGYTVSGSATTAGFLSGSFSSTVSAELGSISPVVVNYTANPVNQRSFTVTTSTVALGRFLITGTNFSATTSVQSTGTFGTTASGTLGTFSTQNGLTLALTSGSADFAGQTNSQTAGYTVSGSATTAGSLSGSFSSTVSAEFGSINPVVVNYTANPVNQRVFTTNTSALNFGFVHQGGSFGSQNLVVSSDGLNATTASGTLGTFSGGPAGFSLGLLSGSAQFNGAAASQSTTYTLSGSAAGVISGTFTSTVSAEFGSIPSVSVAVSGTVYTGNATWSTNGGGNWGTLTGTGANAFSLNWLAAGGSPGLDSGFTNTDTATFGNALLTSGTAEIFLSGANPSLRSITFNNTAGSYAIYPSDAGATITLSSATSALVTTLAGTHAIHTEVDMLSNSIFNVAANAVFEMHGVLSGSANLTKSGAGLLEFYGDNDFVGSTFITDGSVFIEAGTNPFGLASNAVDVSGTAVLDLNGRLVPNLITLSGSGASVINAFAGYTATIIGTNTVASGTGAAIIGNYSVTSTGSAAFQGPMGGFASIAGGGQATFENQITGTGNVTVAASGIAVFSGTQGGIVSTSGSSTFNGPVTEQVTVNAGYAGFNAATGTGSTINVNGGLGVFAGAVGGISHVTSASGTATYSGAIESTAGIQFLLGGVGKLLDGASVAANILNNGPMVVDRSVSNLTIPTVVSGTGSLTKIGSAGVIFSGANTYTGPTTISAGSLQIGDGGTTGSLSPSSVITNNGTLVFNRSNTVTQGTDFYSGNITGSGGLTQAGSGVLVLNQINQYSGVTSILSGTISAAEIFSSAGGSNIGRPSSGNESVLLANQGTLLYTGTTNTYSRGFTLSSGGGKLVVSASSTKLTISNQSPVTGTGNFTIGGAGDVLVQSLLSQSGGLRYNGTGVLTLNEDMTYTGLTNVDSGKLIVNDPTGSKGSIASSVYVSSGAVLGGVGSISGTIAGGGLVSPGASPGILTATSFDPTGGITLGLEFTVANGDPNWSSNKSSQNDVLRLTGTNPFVAALTNSNVVDVYFAADLLPLTPWTSYVEGGFYSDTMTPTQLYDAVKKASIIGWVATTGTQTGTRTFNGQTYNPISSYPGLDGMSVITVARTANFGDGGGPVDGSVTQFVVTPEPATWVAALAGAGIAALHRGLARRRKRQA